MKKFFSMAILAAVILLGQNFAAARDVYVGTYSSSGNNAYLMTETVRGYKTQSVGINAITFFCTVRAIEGTQSFYIRYLFYQDRYGGWTYANSEGFTGAVNSTTPVNQGVLNYVLSNFTFYNGVSVAEDQDLWYILGRR